MSKDWTARYDRAAAQAPVRALPQLCGAFIDGYWVDAAHFFFLDQERGEDGCVLEVPAVFDVAAQSVRRLLDRDELSKLALAFSGSINAPLSFDMPGSDRLAIGWAGVWRIYDLARHALGEEMLHRADAAVFAPNLQCAAVLDGYDLALADLSGKIERSLTNDGARHHAYGRAPENDTSPILGLQRPQPIALWSEDSQWLLTHRIDERGLPESGLIQHAPPDGGAPILHRFKLSAIADRLPQTELVALHIPSGRRLTAPAFETHAFSPIALRTVWFVDDTHVAFVQTDRYSRRQTLHLWDLQRDVIQVVLEETVQHGWLRLNPVFGAAPNVAVFPEHDTVIWWSERDGWGHLYSHSLSTGAQLAQLTHGNWQVRDIIHVDCSARTIYFTAGGRGDGDPGLRQVCSVDFAGGPVRVLAADSCDVAAPLPVTRFDRPFRPPFAHRALSPGGARLVVRSSALMSGARTSVLMLSDGERAVLAKARPSDHAPRPITVTAADGVTDLYGALFLPSDFDPARRYPLLDMIYPGPQMPNLPRMFGTRSEAMARSFAELGLAVLLLDTRHMPLRSRALHEVGYGEEWEPQLADHAAAIAQLCARYTFIDPARIGMIGISGGGAATARALFTYPKLYRTGVSVCGNHDSRLYRSVWMDTYVGPNGAHDSHHANAHHAGALEGDLMLVTGDMDDNVLPSQTFALADALIRHNKDFELLVAPNEGHLVLVTSAYVLRRVWDFLVRTLIGETPPKAYLLAWSDKEKAAYARALAREFSA